MSDVKSYFHDLFPRYRGEELDGIDFSDFPLSSVCGVRCVEIMHRGKAFMDICDGSCSDNIGDQIAIAIRIICHG